MSSLPERVRFLLDENVDPEIQRQLERKNADIVVWCVGDPAAPPRGTADPDILLWCEAEGFALVTNNRSSMPVHLAAHLMAGRYVPGIFLIADWMTIGDVMFQMEVIATSMDRADFANIISYLPIREDPH